ncbi:methyltransferase domain-containing protein [Hyaloraphidium curvatum]|nr:methyltransferase domain-containing protein [Hyaloraphidium curvatum]
MWLQISQKNCPNARYDETSWDRVVAFNPFDPEWSCPDEERIGPFALDSNEGGKWICFVPKPGEPCLVYSVGSNYDFSFEKAVKQLNAGCEVHTFDPTTDVARSRALAVGVGSTFHPWAFGRDRSVAQIADELGHSGRRIDILKIDCERCELKPSFLSTFSKCRKGRDGSDPPIGQILMEVHLPEPPEAPFPAVKALFDAFDGCGFRTFHKEPNVEWAGGYNAIEFALVDPRAARESFWRAACPEVPLDAFLQATGYR